MDLLQKVAYNCQYYAAPIGITLTSGLCSIAAGETKEQAIMKAAILGGASLGTNNFINNRVKMISTQEFPNAPKNAPETYLSMLPIGSTAIIGALALSLHTSRISSEFDETVRSEPRYVSIILCSVAYIVGTALGYGAASE